MASACRGACTTSTGHSHHCHPVAVSLPPAWLSASAAPAAAYHLSQHSKTVVCAALLSLPASAPQAAAVEPIPLAALCLKPVLQPSLWLDMQPCRHKRRLLARSSSRSVAAQVTRHPDPTIATGRQGSPDPDSLSALQNMLQTSSSQGSTPDVLQCNQLLQDCAACTAWPQVWSCYQEAETAGVLVSEATYACLWTAALQAGWLNQSVHLFRRCATVWGPPDQQTYTTIISQLLKRRHRRGLPARQLAYQLWCELRNVHKGHLDEVSLRAGISASCAVGRIHDEGGAEDLMRLAAKQQIRPGRGTFNRLIAAHAERGDMVAATQVFNRLRALYKPDTISWNTMISGYAHIGDMQAAQAVLTHAQAQRFMPDAWTWSSLVHGYTHVGDMQAAEQIVARLVQWDQQQQQQQQEAVIAGSSRMARAGAVATPTGLSAGASNASHLQPSTGEGQVNGQLYVNGSEGARRPSPANAAGLHSSMLSSVNGHQRHEATPLNGVASRSSHTHASKSGVHLEETSPQGSIARSSGAHQSDVSTAGIDVSETESSGSQQVAVTVLPGQRLVSPYMYASLVDGYMRTSNPEAAEQALRRLVTEAGLPPNRVVYNALINGYCKRETVQGYTRAMQLLHEMQAAGLQPGADTFTTLLSVSSALHSNHGQTYSSQEEDTPFSRTRAASNPATSNGGPINGVLPTTARTANGATVSVARGIQQQAVNGVPVSTGLQERDSWLDGSGVLHLQPGPLQPGANGSSHQAASSIAVGGLNGGHKNGDGGRQINSSGHDRADDELDDGIHADALDDELSIPFRPSRPEPVNFAAQNLARLWHQVQDSNIAPDAAVMTALMLAYVHAGDTAQALLVWEALSGNPHAPPDEAAWAALAAVHARAGDMDAAMAAADRSADVAAQLKRRVPAAAYGVIVRTARKRGDLQLALKAYHQLIKRGGRPYSSLLDELVIMCLENRQLEAASRAVHVSELAGMAVDRQRYKQLFASWRVSQTKPDNWERLKWLFGFPNHYYEPDAWIPPDSNSRKNK